MQSSSASLNTSKKIAIACQGGGIHGAFGYGVLEAILTEAGRFQTAKGNPPPFEITALSGTSSGALNAFMVWYGLLSNPQQPFSKARAVLKQLWDTFQVRKTGEASLNTCAQFFYQWQNFGVHLTSPAPVLSQNWVTMPLLQAWSAVGNTLSPNQDLGQIRPEFYDFKALMQSCAPDFPNLTGWRNALPRLLIGAVEILSGTFEVFDSHDMRTGPEARPISYDAVAASGTLPEVRAAQAIPGLKNQYGQDCLYWDGLFSQNPPVRDLIADTPFHHIPDELWVIHINPRHRDRQPVFASEIDDRWNELSGNLSLNQELYFINKVNEWVASGKLAMPDKKHIDIYLITMGPAMADLGVSTKFNRASSNISRLHEHGVKRGRTFLEDWANRTMHLWRY